MHDLLTAPAEVRIGLGADLGQDAPAALALGAIGRGGDDGDAGHLGQAEGIGRRRRVRDGDAGGDAQIGEIDRPSAARRRGVLDMDDRRRLEAGADAPARRSISSAPVTTRRMRQIAAHSAASASSRQAAGVAGKSSRCTELSSPGCRASQTSSMVNGRTGASQVVSRANTWAITARQARRRGLSGASQ